MDQAFAENRPFWARFGAYGRDCSRFLALFSPKSDFRAQKGGRNARNAGTALNSGRYHRAERSLPARCLFSTGVRLRM